MIYGKDQIIRRNCLYIFFVNNKKLLSKEIVILLNTLLKQMVQYLMLQCFFADPLTTVAGSPLRNSRPNIILAIPSAETSIKLNTMITYHCCINNSEVKRAL